MTRRTMIHPVIAAAVLVIEVGALVGSVTGEPFAPVEGWGATRRADAIAFVLATLGCGALAFLGRFPVGTAVVATASYVGYALLDYELGMFLPPMVIIFALIAWHRHRLIALLCAGASLGAAAAWTGRRAATIQTPGVALLTWVAFGSVLFMFFLLPILAAELVRARTQLRDDHSDVDRGLGQGPGVRPLGRSRTRAHRRAAPPTPARTPQLPPAVQLPARDVPRAGSGNAGGRVGESRLGPRAAGRGWVTTRSGGQARADRIRAATTEVS